jgi:hypothetical protein
MKIVKPSIKLLFSFLAVFLILTIWLDATAQDRKETRQEKKARKAKEQLELFQKARKAILDTTFVVYGESIQFKNSGVYPVSGIINFLLLNGNTSVMQFGSEQAWNPGLNTLGGVTLDGNVTNLKITDKKDKVFVSYTLMGAVATIGVRVSINGSYKASVDIDVVTRGYAFSMLGILVEPGEYNLYKGTEY